MAKSNIHGRTDQRKVNPDWFTGKTWMKAVSERIGMTHHDMYHVHFEDGSRTKLHKHNGDQILVVTGGKGSLETFEKSGTGRTNFGIRRSSRTALKDGDVVRIPAGMLHTHGSTDDGMRFSHIALNIHPTKSTQYKTTWYESDCRSSVSGVI